MNKSYPLVINDNLAESEDIIKMVQALCSLSILKSCGGYILTYRRHKSRAYIGVMPSIISGQRCNHYDLKAGPETKVFLTGGINIYGEISLLFKISKTELNDQIISELRKLYISLANVLIKNGYEGPGILDWITRKIIEESRLFYPIPSTIYEMTTASGLTF